MHEDIDLDQRPTAYFRPQALEDHLIAKVSNTVAREKLKTMAEAGLDRDTRASVAQDALTDGTLRALEAVHPMFMGGNYLDEPEDGEIEIARISIRSTTSDVTSVYARPVDGLIHYRVVDEYGGETLQDPCEAQTAHPMSLGELADFFLSAWPLQELLEAFFDGDLEAQLEYFRAESEFYPRFDALCRRRVIDRFQE